MTELSIAILGLGRVGASVGLALKRYMDSGGKYQFKITGFDRRGDVGKKAKEINAIDQFEKRDYIAARDKEIIVLDLPYDEVKQTYEAIAPDLKEGVVILDSSPLKKPSIQWANKYLPEGAHLVGVTAIINPDYLFNNINDIESATGEFFENGAMILAPAASCMKEAVDLAHNFASILGTTSHFLDPAEHDSLIAFTEGFPSLMGVALFYGMSRNPGWGDLQRFTNPAIAALVRVLHDQHPDSLRDQWMLNDENLTRALDHFVAIFTEMRDLIAGQDRDAIEAALIEASNEYERWVNRRMKAKWDEKVQLPTASSGIMTGLFGSRIASRFTGDRDDE